MFCKKRKISCYNARDGNEAFESYRKLASNQEEKRPIFVSMDLQMPHCSGLEATLAIRKYEKENQLTPCVIYMVTAQSGQGDRDKSEEAGCNGFLVKPLRLLELDEILVKHSSAV